jgi:hypothetical protein
MPATFKISTFVSRTNLYLPCFNPENISSILMFLGHTDFLA